MDDDQNTPSEPVVEMPAPELAPTPTPAPEPAPTPVEPESSQPNGSTPTDLPPEAPEPPISDSAPISVESDNSGLNQPVQSISVQSEPQPASFAPVSLMTPPVPQPQTSIAPQPQSPAQQDQAGFIHSLLVKAQAKIQSNKQKKLDLLMQSVSKKGKIDNREAVKLLRISDKTAERYLNKLVAQGRLKRSGAGRDVIYTPI
jgi:hypothetical protein